jgi:hypothetical protein
MHFIIIIRFFGDVDNSTLHSSYIDLMVTIASTNYTNMGLLEPFKDLPHVSRANFLEISFQMHRDYSAVHPTYARVMTEVSH